MNDLDDLLSPNSVINAATQTAAVAPQYIAGIVACIGSVLMGYCLGFSSPTLDDLIKEGILDTTEKQTWFGSLVTIGAMIGGPIAAVLVGKMGRKGTIIACCIPYAMGWLFIILTGQFTHYYQFLFLARILCGIGMGMASLSVPLYIGEIASKEHRGTIGTGIQLSVTIGILLVYSVGEVLSWRWLAVVGAAMTGLLIVLMLFLPETPHWLLGKHNRNGALTALRWLRGPNVELEHELQDIAVMLDSQQSGNFRLNELMRRGVLMPTFISLGLMFFQQMCGINAIVFYAGPIFKEAGYKGDPNNAALIVGAVLVVATFVACLLMDRVGRRVLLLIAGTFMCLSSVGLGVYYYLENPSISWLPLVSVNVFVIAFSLGWGPIPWLILGELFPSRIKGLASGIAAAFNWTLAFIITKEFSTMEEGIHKYGTFWLFASIIFVSIIFVALCMPETKGKTLDEIQRLFEKQSSNDVPSVDNDLGYERIIQDM